MGVIGLSCSGVPATTVMQPGCNKYLTARTNTTKMSQNFEQSIAFKTACDLVFKGKEQPSGYTEPLLHLNRLNKKSNLNLT